MSVDLVSLAFVCSAVIPFATVLWYGLRADRRKGPAA